MLEEWKDRIWNKGRMGGWKKKIVTGCELRIRLKEKEMVEYWKNRRMEK